MEGALVPYTGPELIPDPPVNNRNVEDAAAAEAKKEVRDLRAQVTQLEQEKEALLEQLNILKADHLVQEQVFDEYLHNLAPSPFVNHLKLPVLSGKCSGVEKQFLDKFPHVTKMEVELVKGTGNSPEDIVLPAFFEGLRVLNLGRGEDSEFLFHYLFACLSAAGKRLEELRLPFLGKELVHRTLLRLEKGIRLKKWRNLKTIDMSGLAEKCWFNSDNDMALHTFLETCASFKVRLLNPSTSWSLPEGQVEEKLWQLGRCVRSLEMHACSRSSWLWALDLSWMESLEVSQFGEWVRELHLGKGNQVLEKWTSLRKMTLFIPKSPDNAQWLVNFLLRKAPNLEDLRVEFEQGNGKNVLSPFYLFQGLRKLTLVNYGQSGILELLRECTGLEELCLDGCFGLVHNNANQQRAFLQLQKLRKLSLKRADLMTGLGDEFFRTVISNLRLTRLEITSQIPLVTVTRAGIESLLGGPFTHSVKEFRFEGWSLEDVYPEEFQALGQRICQANSID